MTNAEMKAEVAKHLGNMKSSNIWYAEIQNWVNRALNRVVQLGIGGNRQNLNLFYELQTSWTTSAPTTLNQNWIALPSDKLAIVDVQTYNKSAAVDKNADRTYPMRFIPYKDFLLIPRDSNVTDWPRLWSRRGKRIYIWPTPHTDYLTNLELVGIQKEPELSAAGDTPIIDEQWHDIVVAYATYLGASAMDWAEKALTFKTLAYEQIKLTADFVGIEDAATNSAVTVEGMPNRGNVYG